VKQSSACYLLHAGFLPGLFFNPEDGSNITLLKCQMTFNGLHSITSQKTELLITTTVRIANSANLLVKFNKLE
jgi:hypothetical protein